jgi:dTDP-4-amino-4,6-dideoxygalactose transaminase
LPASSERSTSQVQLPTEAPDRLHVFNQYVIRTAQRDRLRDYLGTVGIPTEIYYPFPLHLQRAFSYLGYQAGTFPQAESASHEVLALPIYPELNEAQQQSVVDSVADFFTLSAQS